ncbi:MAG: galactonate dehydratase [Paenibacillaceae bacterium]|jgi:galactonate dehydratase|nr:galactonate dehydratase [Paenibacillaceae bacterium]
MASLKITKLEIIKVPPSWVWVYIHTDSGITGLGEPYLEGHADSVIAEVKRLEPYLIGEDPTRTEFLWNRMYLSGSGYKGGPIKMSAISGLDMALWDIKGKEADLPIYQLLGGLFRKKVKMYHACTNIPPFSVTPGLSYKDANPNPGRLKQLLPEEYAKSAKILIEEWGFKALKLHFHPGEIIDRSYDESLMAECVAAVRSALGKEIDIAVDAHNSHPTRSIQLARALEPSRPLFLEEPVPVERIDFLGKVAASTFIPIAAGERWMGKHAFLEALQHGASVLQPDIAHAGGFTELKKIAGMAEAYQATMAPHCPLGPISLAASLQLAASLPNFLIQEHNQVNDCRIGSRTMIGYGYFRNPFELDSDGCVSVPDAPGLGVELDPDGMAEIMSKPWSTTRA